MMTQARTTRPSRLLSLKDRLSRLTFLEACKLLGPEGKKLIQQNANSWDFDPDQLQQAFVGAVLFRLQIPALFGGGERPVVTITLLAEARNRLHVNCTACHGACEHLGAVFSLILEQKTALGLAAPP